MLGKVSARDADLVPILDNLPDSSLLLAVDYESREALVVALRKLDEMQSAGAKIQWPLADNDGVQGVLPHVCTAVPRQSLSPAGGLGR